MRAKLVFGVAAAAVVGYARGPLPVRLRITAGLAGAALLMPGVASDVGGLAVLLLVAGTASKSGQV